MGKKRRVKLFVACSLDNFIAGPEGEIDWLFTDNDYGYHKFISRVDTILMGRKTYEKVMSLGGWPYGERRTYVFSHGQPDGKLPRGVSYTDRDPQHLIEELRAEESDDHIWLNGGGELSRQFIARGLVDDIVVAVHPILLGSGVPLFPDDASRTVLRLKKHRIYDNGMVHLSYRIK